MFKNPYQLSPEDVQSREAKIQDLKQNRDVIALLHDLGKDERFLADHSAWFNDYAKVARTCRSCPGLDFCQQPLRGKYKSLFRDPMGFINDQYVSCRFARQKSLKEKNKKMYRIRHFDDEQLQINLKNIDLSSESQKYMLAFDSMLKSKAGPKGVFLCGEPGTGKTYMSIGLANQYIEETGRKVAFVNMARLVSDIKSNLKDDEYRQRIMDILMKVPFLFLDDIGAEQITPWTRDSILFPILDYRMNHRLKTYFTSNFNMKDIEERYTLDTTSNEKVAALRLMERIRTLSTPVKLSGQSRRK